MGYRSRSTMSRSLVLKILALALVLVYCDSAHSQKAEAYSGQYSTFVNGSNFGIYLHGQKGDVLKTISMTHGDNTTLIAQTAGLAAHKTISVLLDEAAGGRCDACRTMTEHLISTMAQVVKDTGSMKEDGGKYRISVDNDAASKAVSSMCSNAAYEKYAVHITKACAEFLSENGTDVVNTITGMINEGDLAKTFDAVCVKKLGACKSAPKLPEKPSKCRLCMETMSLFEYRLRRDSRAGLDTTALKDSMNLGKRKAVDTSYLSRKHVQTRLPELCQDMRASMFISEAPAQALVEFCDEIVTDHEDEVVGAFAKSTAGSAIRKVCIDTAEVCDAQTYDQLKHDLATSPQRVAFGPLDITIREGRDATGTQKLTPAQRAVLADHKVQKKATPVAAQRTATKPSAPQASKLTNEDLIGKIQDFLDEMEAAGRLTAAEQDGLLKKAFKADAALLRCYRMNQAKGSDKLLARMKLLLPRK